MRTARILFCVVAICAAGSALSEIVKFSESSAQPFVEQDKSREAYVRAALDVEGALPADAPALKTLDKGLVGKNGRIEYKFQTILLRPEKPAAKGATLLLETEPETGAGADLLDVARERRVIVLYLLASFDGLSEPLQIAVLRDLIAHMRKSFGVAHVIARGSERKAEFLQKAQAPLTEKKNAVAAFDGLLLHDRTIATQPAETVWEPIMKAPFIVETFSSSVYWRDDVKFAAREIAPPEDKKGRVFFLAGAASQSGAKTQNCTALVNSRSIAPALRALFVALDDYLSKGIAIPASRFPQKSNGSLILARDAHWPKAPNLDAPLATGDRLIPAIDSDGNETAGLRLPDQAVPIASFLGWNAKKEKTGPPCEACGAALPFASSKAERDKSGDERLSLQERFGLRDFYVATVRTIADRLVKERLLLKPDADAYVAAAKKAPF
jgi:hypothetical protein